MAANAPADASTRPALRIGFLGPEGTFTEEALLSEADYESADILPMGSLPEVLDAVQEGQVDLGFVPMENAIEGTVRDIIDSLVFDFDLRIQREVVLDIHLHLMAPPGTTLADVERVASIPMATAQCRGFLNRKLPTAETLAANSTAEAARLLGEGDPAMTSRPTAAIAPRLASTLYGLDILVEDVEDHPENQTRFVSLAKSGIPAPTGHDRTSIACFQSADHPGSLYAILGQFADAVVGDCLRDLHAELAGVKFLGSYPAAGPTGPAIRRDAEASTRRAFDWVEGLRSEIRSNGGR